MLTTVRGRWVLATGLVVAMLLATSGVRERRAAAPDASTVASAQPSERAAGSGVAAGKHEFEVRVGGRVRSYVLHVPPDVRDASLVVVFHGGGGDWEHGARISGFDAAADRHGFLVAFPNGTGRLGDRLLTFNAGTCCGYALDQQVDDVAFFRALIADLQRHARFDSNRVFVTGMSNGAMLAYRLACEAGELVAAIAPVAGALQQPHCTPAQPVALLAIHGTDDRHVLFRGGAPEVQLDPHARVDASFEANVSAFARLNGCATTRETSTRRKVERWVWSGCIAAVEAAIVHGGAHAWPGGVRGSAFGDRPTDDLDATEAIWAFFKAHGR